MRPNYHIFIIVVIAIIFASGCSDSQASRTGHSISSSVPQCKDVKVPYESQEEYLKTEYYTETVPYTDQECEAKKLVYSVTNFMNIPSVCNKQEEVCHKSYPILGCTDKTVYCVDRSVYCSLNLNNLDDERGTWSFKFDFFKRGSNSVDATGKNTNKWLYPHTSETIYGIGRITKKELLTTTYTCRYYVTNEPTKQICRDVIKYRDIKKERQVTAYRPVTKYRTEKKCN